MRQENGDWLRRRQIWRWWFALPTVPVPFFGRRRARTVEKGDRHRADGVFPRVWHLPRLGASPPFPLLMYAGKWGLAPSTTDTALVVRVADGACPLFRMETPAWTTKRGFSTASEGHRTGSETKPNTHVFQARLLCRVCSPAASSVRRNRSGTRPFPWRPSCRCPDEACRNRGPDSCTRRRAY